MSIEEQDQPAGGLDRRSLLKKGAIGGAIAWTAPAILSSPAFAGTGSPGCSAPARLTEQTDPLGIPYLVFTIGTANVRACLGCPSPNALTAEAGEGVDGTVGVAGPQITGSLLPEATGFRVRFRGCDKCVDIVYTVSGLTATQVGSDLC